jgi:hypothetical protein
MREPRGDVRFWVLLIILVALLSQVGTCVVVAWSVREVSQAAMIAVRHRVVMHVGCTMTTCCGSSCGSKLSVENLPRPEPRGLHRAPCSRHHGRNSRRHRSCLHCRHGKDSRRGWQARFMPVCVSICERQIVQAKDTHPPRPDLIASSSVCLPAEVTRFLTRAYITGLVAEALKWVPAASEPICLWEVGTAEGRVRAAAWH